MTKENVLCIKKHGFKCLLVIYEDQTFDLLSLVVVGLAVKFRVYPIWCGWFRLNITIQFKWDFSTPKKEKPLNSLINQLNAINNRKRKHTKIFVFKSEDDAQQYRVLKKLFSPCSMLRGTKIQNSHWNLLTKHSTTSWTENALKKKEQITNKLHIKKKKLQT